MRRHPLHADDGSVTVEFVTVLPAVLVIVAAVLGGFHLVVQQMRVADAASSAARLLGRDDEVGAAEVVSRLVGTEATLEWRVDGRFVCATVTMQGGATAPILAVPLVSTTCAMAGGE